MLIVFSYFYIDYRYEFNLEYYLFMKQKNRFAISIFFILALGILTGCDKKEGKTYLRVINSFDVGSEIIVKDNKHEIPVDGNYYEASGYLETKYKLLNVAYDSLFYRTPTVIADTVFKKNITVSGYFGDFEMLPHDSYYTLTLNYKIEYGDPWNLGNNWHFIIINYLDNSKLSYSPLP
jgi:hypothetical protein